MFSCSSLVLLFVLALTQAVSTEPLQARTKPASTDVLKTYPIPSGIALASSFEVKVRVPNGPWQNVSTYRPLLAQINVTTGSSSIFPSSMAYFDFNGTVEVHVVYNNSQIKNPRVRPDSYGIIPTKSGNTVKFTLDQPRNIVFQVNDNIFDCLHLFTNPLEIDVPSPDDPNVIYYGPGVHNVGILNVPSNKTVYVAGGAVLIGTSVGFMNVTNAGIRGRGVLTSSTAGTISATGSKNITVDGLIGLNFLARAYESNGITIRNWRSFSSIGWGDGIDFFCSKNVLMDGVFVRSSDDSLAIYNHRNSSLWADVAHPIVIGTHGNTANPETIDSITIRNIDILDHREKQMLYQGCIAINPGDNNLVQNVLVEDVRVENFRLGQLINMRVMFNDKYNTSPGRGIRNVTVRNLSYDGTNGLTSLLVGYDAERTISDVTFQNLTINGQSISDKMRKPGWYLTSDYVPMFVNEHVKNLTFLP